MPCCGQNRANVFTAQTRVATPPASQPNSTNAAAAQHGVPVRYTENSPIVVRGPASGQAYIFSGRRPVQAVDPRDAEILLRTAFFRRT